MKANITSEESATSLMKTSAGAMNDISKFIRPLWQLLLGFFGIYCAIQDEPSPLLDLPAELQNGIWELACTPTQTHADHILPGQRVELQHAARFKADLLVVCHKIHEDAVGLFKSARDRYWRDTAFVLNYTTLSILGRTLAHLSALDTVSEDALKRIQHLTIQGSTFSEDRTDPPDILKFEDGIWRRTYTPRGPGGSYEEYVVLVSKNVMEGVRERGHIRIRCPKRLERVKNQPLHCRAYSTFQNESRYAGEDGEFHVICANVSERNAHIMRVLAEDMNRKSLTHSHLEGIVYAHACMHRLAY